MSGVLDGVRVLDVTAWQAGPMVTMVLGDFGAEVLKIEPPSGDPMRALANSAGRFKAQMRPP